jgi:hypothetical protein
MGAHLSVDAKEFVPKEKHHIVNAATQEIKAEDERVQRLKNIVIIR